MLTDPYDDNWLDTLQQRARALSPARKLHVLIDGAFGPGLHRRLPAGRYALLFEGLPGSGRSTLDVSPFVLPFSPDDRDVNAVLRGCQGWPMVNVIETPEPWQDLAARLAAWCVIEADGQRFNLRFADTRRLPAVLKTLTASQRRQFAGPAVSWSYIARDGTWHTLALDGADEHIASDPQLDEAQFGALVEDSRADEILARLAASPDCGAFLPSKAYTLISSALASARKIGLTDRDLVGWCDWLWTRGGPGDTEDMTGLVDMWKAHASSDGDDR
jgi:hypothetical protein